MTLCSTFTEYLELCVQSRPIPGLGRRMFQSAIVMKHTLEVGGNERREKGIEKGIQDNACRQ